MLVSLGQSLRRHAWIYAHSATRSSLTVSDVLQSTSVGEDTSLDDHVQRPLVNTKDSLFPQNRESDLIPKEPAHGQSGHNIKIYSPFRMLFWIMQAHGINGYLEPKEGQSCVSISDLFLIPFLNDSLVRSPLLLVAFRIDTNI